MKLIVGLGNPGTKYERTRHNVGFMVASALADKHGIRLSSKAYDSLVGKGKVCGEEVAIALPQTYMNRSGQAVTSLSSRRKVEPAEILVICDDVNLELGIIRIRAEGSAGGHNGLASIIEHLGSCDFARLRIGISRSGGPALSGYVLSPFTKSETETLECAIEKAVECCETWVKDGAERAANLFNAKNRKE
ncbi:MAG: aminoacyl-tRNA hydrolase [Candidatus Omnitrophica bacterium]|jgi:PTH1 family peptidyl-tRNA hydrolase|nr:aminoacyl-tRNA hydrolase [Candidatus Omnitrophota bacterium]